MSAISPTTRRWMSPPPHYDTPHVPQGSTTTLTPYLTLPYILSLTWLAYPIISLLFVAFRLALSSASAQDSVADAKSNLLASCAAAERAATTAASLPRYMARGTNNQIAAAANGMMNAARATLVLSLTIVEAIINFVIDIYRSTFLCFLELVVRGGLALLIGAVAEINDFLSNTFSSIRSTIQDNISSINSAIQTAINGINDINPFSDITAPQFDVPDLSVIDNVTLPDSVQQGLVNLNSTLPTVDEIKDAIKDFIGTPFELLKADINDTFAGLNFNPQTLAVPSQQTLSFCGDMDTSVVDDLGRDLVKFTRIGIVILVILALLLIAAHCALEWYKWRCLQQHLEYTRQAWVTDPTMNNAVQNGETPTMKMTNHNLLVLAGSQQHPLLTRIANQLSGLFKLTPSQHTNLQWFFHYVFHPPAMAVFLIGFLGLLSVQVQLLAIRPIEERYNARVASSVSDFSGTIATSMNDSMRNQSAEYASSVNAQMDSTQSTINDGMFGWVNGTTTTLNTTLNDFYSDVQNVVSLVFNGTVLNDPMQEFIRCLIGTKIEALESAITFLHDNLVVNMPRMNESALVLSQDDVDEASRPIAAAAVGDGSEGNQGLVGKLVARYVESLKKERLMFAVFLALWGLVVLIALLIILWHSRIKPKREERKKRKFYRSEQRNFTSFITPYKADVVIASDPAPAPAYNANDTKADGTVERNLGVSGADEKTSRDGGVGGVGGFFNINLTSPTAPRATSHAYTQQHQPQRSWDPLLETNNQANRDSSANGVPERPGKSKLKMMNISRPRKLTAIGSKAGKERFVSDEERVRMQTAFSTPDGNEDERENAGWMSRLTNAFSFRGKTTDGNKDEYDDEDSWFGPASSPDRENRVDRDNGGNDSMGSVSSNDSKPRHRPRPNLTIRTSLSNTAYANVSRDKLPTASGDAPPTGTRTGVPRTPTASRGLGLGTSTHPSPNHVHTRNNPPSAWSISPSPGLTPRAPRSLPWLPNTASTAGKRMNGLKVKNVRAGRKPNVTRGMNRLPGLPASPRPVDAQRVGGAMSPGGTGGLGFNGGNTPSIGAFPGPTRLPTTPRAAVTITPAAQVPTQNGNPFSPQTAYTGNASVPSYYYNYNRASQPLSSSVPTYSGVRRESLLPENPFSSSYAVGSGRGAGKKHMRTSSVPLLRQTPGVGVGATTAPHARAGSVTTPMASIPEGTDGSNPKKATNGGDAGGKSDPAPQNSNPFQTPFDDDARVIPENWPQPPSHTIHTGTPTTGNPFLPRAF